MVSNYCGIISDISWRYLILSKGVKEFTISYWFWWKISIYSNLSNFDNKSFWNSITYCFAVISIIWVIWIQKDN